MLSFSRKSAWSRSSSLSQWLLKSRTSLSEGGARDRADGSTSRSATTSAPPSRRGLIDLILSLRTTSAHTRIRTRSREDEPAAKVNQVALGQCQ